MGLPVTSMDRSVVVQQTDIVEDAQNIIRGEENPNSEELDDMVQNGMIGQGELEGLEVDQ